MRPELVADQRCQRGLRWTLALPDSAPEQDHVRAVLAASFPEAVGGFEQWGAQRVDRLIIQFRVELRLGERPGQLTVMFRSCCPEPKRALIRERLFTGLAPIFADGRATPSS